MIQVKNDDPKLEGIDKMEVGPEMDALVAEKVMGWIWHEWIDVFHVEDTEWLDEIRYGPIRCAQMVLAPGDFGPQGPPGKFRSAPPRYSTDISDAMKVWEKFTTRSCFYHDAYCEWQVKLDGCRALFEDCRWEGWGDTLPEAICRAALL